MTDRYGDIFLKTLIDVSAGILPLPLSEMLLRSLLDTVPLMMWSATPEGAPSYLNQRVADYTGLSLKEYLKLGLWKRIHADDIDETDRVWSHAVRTGSSYHVRHRLLGADGEYRWFLVRGEPLRNNEGCVTQFLCVNVDIDESINLEKALHHAHEKFVQASQTATLAELTALLKEPLQAVLAHARACLQWLNASPPNIQEARVSTARIVVDTNAAAEAVTRICAPSERMAAAKVRLDINDLLYQVCALMAGEIQRSKVSLKTELAQDMPMIKADPMQIQQVIINLVRNAIEASVATVERPLVVIIRSRRDGDDIVVDVKDHGTGLADIENVFAPLFTTKETGMGMGLAICRSIVEAHAGRIWFTPNEVFGVTFSFSLPIAGRMQHESNTSLLLRRRDVVNS